MDRDELQAQLIFAKRSLAEIEAEIAHQQELVRASDERGVDPELSRLLLTLFAKMRVFRALHLQYVTEELEKSEPPRKDSRPVFGVLTTGRVATGLVDAIPSRIP
jgi:hypothetical protein